MNANILIYLVLAIIVMSNVIFVAGEPAPNDCDEDSCGPLIDVDSLVDVL